MKCLQRVIFDFCDIIIPVFGNDQMNIMLENIF